MIADPTGKIFEQAVGAWLQAAHGYRVQFRVPVRAKWAARGYEVDVIASRTALLSERHIWVECKSGKKPVKRNSVHTLAGQVTDVLGLNHAFTSDWVPDECWMFAASGFDFDALNIARKHAIRCFVPANGDWGAFSEISE